MARNSNYQYLYKIMLLKQQIIDVCQSINQWMPLFLKEQTLNFFFANLDPSHFQNVILAIVAIYLPFAIVFLTDAINQKQTTDENPKADFERIVLQDEVFKVGYFFRISIVIVAIFAFFSAETCGWGKLLAIILMIASSLWLWMYFKRLLKYSKGRNQKLEFQLSYLKSLHLNHFWLIFVKFSYWLYQKTKLDIFLRICNWKIKININKIIVAWEPIWQAKDERGFQRKFLDCFIAHVDSFIVLPVEWGDLYQLLSTYANHCKCRDTTITQDIYFKKLFEWQQYALENDIHVLTNDRRIYIIFPMFIEKYIKCVIKIDDNLQNKQYTTLESLIDIYPAFLQEIKKYITKSYSINCQLTSSLFSRFYTPIFDKIALEISDFRKENDIENWKACINNYTKLAQLQKNEIELVKECIRKVLLSWYSKMENKDKKFTMEAIRTIFEV